MRVLLDVHSRHPGGPTADESTRLPLPRFLDNRGLCETPTVKFGVLAPSLHDVDLIVRAEEDPPAYAQPIWDDYLSFHATRDADRSHQQLHQSHYAYLDPDEERLITPEIIQNFRPPSSRRSPHRSSTGTTSSPTSGWSERDSDNWARRAGSIEFEKPPGPTVGRTP